MLRFLIATLIASTGVLPWMATAANDLPTSEMPVSALYCDTDPGPFNPGGGRGVSLADLREGFGCEPATDASFTFVLIDDAFDFEHPEQSTPTADQESWYERCTIDAEGSCTITAPTGLEYLLGVYLHEGTIRPGYEPAHMTSTTQNVTEFAGYGAVFVKSDNAATSTDPADHQTLAYLLDAPSEEPVDSLTSWVYDDADPRYLATTEGGWVSNVVEPGQEIAVTAMPIDFGAPTDLACGVSGEPGTEVPIELRDGIAYVTIPETDGDVTCTLTLGPK